MNDHLPMTAAQAEELRCRAMLGNDSTAVESLLDARLIFTHASGAVDDKSAYLAKIREGRITYRGITWSDQATVAVSLDSAVMTGRMTVDVLVDDVEKRLENRVTQVWIWTDAWRLLAFQSTPIR